MCRQSVFMETGGLSESELLYTKPTGYAPDFL